MGPMIVEVQQDITLTVTDGITVGVVGILKGDGIIAGDITKMAELSAAGRRNHRRSYS